MAKRKIKLEATKFSEEVVEYRVTVEEEGRMLDYVRAVTTMIDGHYLLERYSPLSLQCEKIKFGIAHSVEEAEERLHAQIKEIAEKLIRGNDTLGDLVDNTRFAPESLPKGGN